MDLIATAEIHRAKKLGKAATVAGERGTPPQTEIIANGAKFSSNEEEGLDLIKMGAARLDPSVKKTEAKKVEAKVEVKKEEDKKAEAAEAAANKNLI